MPKDNHNAEVQPSTPSTSSDAGALVRAFVAGATSFTGRALAVQDASKFNVQPLLQVRPSSKHRGRLQGDPRIVEVDLDDVSALKASLDGVGAVVQLIGTVAARFGSDGDYEKVDYGTTKALLRAAQSAHVSHFVLLSSVGASLPLNSYLRWKKKTEELVRESAIPYTILRPSVLAGDDDFPERSSAANSSAFFSGLSETPFGAPFAHIRPINIQVLARLILHLVGDQHPKNEVLGGGHLFPLAKRLDLV